MDSDRLYKIALRVAAQKSRRDLKWWMDSCHDPPVEQAPQYWRRNIPDKTYREILTSQREQVIKWHKPSIESEIEAFEQAARVLSLDLETVLQKVARGWMEEMSDSVWSQLQNSDSWKIESMEEAEKISNLRDKNLASIIGAIIDGKGVPAPIVLFLSDRTPYLVSGNTRLMAAKALGSVPEVFFADMSTSSPKSITKY